MGFFPAKLKDMNVFNAGDSYAGQCSTFKPPNLKRLMETWRGGGMGGPVKIDRGYDSLDCEWTAGGLLLGVLRQWGATRVDAVQLRFAGAYQDQGTGEVVAVEIVIRGRHEEVEIGEAKVGEDTEFNVKTACAYYKLTVNGEVVIELDPLAGVEIVDGVDMNLEVRQAIGLA